MEIKSVPLELKDIDLSKRTAVIAHATYDNIDRVKDISRKGMFTKSWRESKQDISLYLNHNDEQSPGRVDDVFEDNNHAYTKAWFGTHTLGNDTLIMLDEKVIRYASFGFIPEKTNEISVKGQRVRELKEVRHLETSVLTKMPANPQSMVVSVHKSFSLPKGITKGMEGYEELESIHVKAIKEYVDDLEKFCRNTKASDTCIIAVESVIKEYKEYLSRLDTTTTGVAAQPAVSEKEKIRKQILLLNTKF